MTKSVDGMWLIDGLTLSNNTTDLNNDIDIAMGLCTVRNNDGNLFDVANVNTILTKRLDGTWAEGTNQGGLDTGSKTNSTWYHVFIIKNLASGVVDALFSTSLTPTMPSGYTMRRRIGSILTNDIGNIQKFMHHGENVFYWDIATDDISLTTSATSWTLVSITVPPNISVESIIQLVAGDTATNTNYVWHGNQNPPTDIFRGIGAPRNPSGTSVAQAQTHRVFSNISRQIYYRASASTTDTTIRTHGWVDPRGKN